MSETSPPFRRAIATAAIATLMVFPATWMVGCATTKSASVVDRIVFGSCIDTNEHPMLDRVLTLDYDVAILLGDNIYADTTNIATMRAKYDSLKQSRFWGAFREKGHLLATWDDHDFGANDAGGDYPIKDASQREFLRFLDEPANSQRWNRPGVYDAAMFGPPGKRLQVILLDTRYFRSAPATGENGVIPSGGKYIPTTDTNTTLLGEAQWEWLDKELQKPANVRIIASSIQFISEFSGAEAWANFPHEKRRMIGLLDKHKARNTVFISGDRHWAELSLMERGDGTLIYDLTSSALTQKHPRGTPTPNRYREGSTYHLPNVGIVAIDWSADVPKVTLELLDESGKSRIRKTL